MLTNKYLIYRKIWPDGRRGRPAEYHVDLIAILPTGKEKASPKAGFYRNPIAGLLLGEAQHEIDQLVDVGIGNTRGVRRHRDAAGDRSPVTLTTFVNFLRQNFLG